MPRCNVTLNLIAKIFPVLLRLQHLHYAIPIDPKSDCMCANKDLSRISIALVENDLFLKLNVRLIHTIGTEQAGRGWCLDVENGLEDIIGYDHLTFHC
ncbi:hypothetical protein Xant_22135 [Xanthomonas cissicola]|uniref:Uncharacterized protein n=2 Tax=Xanthomonas cissicola TaxID=86186 RepID=A0ABX3M0J3_9XANT|nr:hypothetical protein Xant_22135 [Xanthomonas cissicola]